MDTFLRDLRYGIRNLLRTPAFTVTAILALTLGIGATAAIFSLVNGVVLRPLPYAEPDRLVTIWDTNQEKGLEHEPISPVTFLDYRALSQVFVDAAAWWRPEVTLRGGDREPVRVNTVEVSGNFQQVLGVQPILGAGFPAGVFHSPDRMAVISHRLWQARFSADPAVIGQRIRLNDHDFVVAGVMPPRFHFPGETDVWQRLVWDLARHSRGAHFMEAVARLQPGVPPARAGQEIEALTARLATEFPLTNRGWRARVIALHDEVVGDFRPALWILLAAVALLLLIACSNVASLLLARAASRAKEVAVRAAIGASRARLIRQFLTESLLLATAGAAGGVALSVIGVRAIAASTPIRIPRIEQAVVDGRVLAFAAALTALTALVFGLLPALFMAGGEAQHALQDSGRGHTGGGRGRTHRMLVAAEVALAVLLMAGAGLLVRSVGRLAAEDPGVQAAEVLTTGVQLSGAAYAEWPQVERFHSALVEALRQHPGVAAAGAGNFLPLAPGWRVPFLIRGLPPPPRGDEPTAQYHSVSEGYFEALGVRLLRGRLFDVHDTAQSRGVVIVNEALARRYFAGENPVGRTIRSLATGIGPLGRSLMTDRDHEIVGVVGDVKNSSLQGAAEPALYHTQRQFPFRHMYVLARGGDQAQLAAAIRATIRRADPSLAIADLRPMREILAEAVDRPRFLMFIMSVFAASALALAALGVYGLLSYAVTERRQELSIRLALGAPPAGLLWMVMRQGLVLTVVGLIAGLAAAFAAARQAASLLFGIAPGDPLTMGSVAAVTLTMALVACIVPAVRASRTEPLAALKE